MASPNALERLTVDVANQLRGDCIRLQRLPHRLPVASEGFVANTTGRSSDWEPCEVAAEGILWMLRQPPSYSGQLASMWDLRQRHGIMASRSARPYQGSRCCAAAGPDRRDDSIFT
jgi:citronellol/citronellal dehydrogenase